MSPKPDLTHFIENVARSAARRDSAQRSDWVLVTWILWATLALTLLPIAIAFLVR